MTQANRAHRAFTPGSVKLAALVLAALTLCAALITRPAQAAEWMQPYLEQVQEWGVMRGDANGNLHEDRSITRAEFVTLVNRAFGYTDVGPNPFSDVDDNAWYAEDICIAHQAGYFQGSSPNTASPMNLVTREQAAVLLGRCLRFQGVTGAANSTFTDMRDIGGWSRGMVQEAADLGIIQGYADGSFRPHLPITRGQMACFLVRALGTLVQEPGEQTSGGVYGNLTITVPGVKLKDTTVTGNLYLTGGVGLGNVELENVNVLGKIIICGTGEAEGGKNSVILRNVTAGSLEVDSLTEQFLSIQAEGLTDIAEMTVRTSAYIEDRTEDGLGFQTLRLDGVDGSRFQLAGNIKRVVNLTPNSTVQVAQGVADIVTMDEKAAGASLTIDNIARIRELNLDTAVRVTGDGGISHLNVNAAGSNVAMLPDTVFVRPGITGNIHNVNMDNKAAEESSEDPRILAGYPAARNVAPTSAEAVFRTNKTGTIHWAVTALMDGSVGEEELMNPSSYTKIFRSGTINATASNTDFTARITGLTKEGSYYISALLVDARGRRSPVKIAAFTTPDDTAPNFATGYPQAPVLTTDADGEQVAQIMVMPTKSCQMYYVLLPSGSTAPTAADFRAAALPGNLGYGVVTLRKNTPFLLSRINTSHLQEKTNYDLYLWLNDADNGKSSAVRKITVTTKDITAPTILRLEATNSADRTVTLTFELDEPGTLSWFVTPRDQSVGINKENPTRQDQIMIESTLADGTRILRRGGPVRFARADAAATFTVTGLEGQTAYDLYYMAKDTAGNYGIYNKSIDFPLPIKTRDNQGPTVEVTFNPLQSDAATNTPIPQADADVILEFSEQVRGVYQQNGVDAYDEFYNLYLKVVNSSGDGRTQAKNDLAAALYRHVRLYPGSPPTRGDPNVDEVTPLHTSGLSDAQIEALPVWIDFREAVVEQAGAKTIIRFPGDNDKNRANSITPAIKLQSGASYFFRLEGIEDTSFNGMNPPTNILYTPRFTMAYATVLLNNNDSEESVNINGESKFAKIFYLTPEGTEAVPSGTRWDMLIWTNASIRYDLYVRQKNGDPTWYHLGQANPNLTNVNASKVYTSVNGNFVNQQISSGLFGFADGDQGRPFLTRFTDELEFAIVPADTTLNKAVHMEVQLFAGTNTELSNISRQGQGTTANLTNRDITPIGDPDPFSVDFAETDLAPTVFIPRGGIIVGSTAAEIQLNLEGDGRGTVSYFAVPLTLDAANPDVYSMFETYPLVNGVTPLLSQIPTSATSDEAGLQLDIDHPKVDDIINGNTNNPETAYGNTGSALLERSGTVIRIQGPNGQPLKPNTTYLLYLATETKTGTQSSNVVCYKFTTNDVKVPKLEVRYDGDNNVSVRTDEDSSVWGVLILDGSNSYLLQPFSTAAGTATTDDYVRASGSGTNGQYLVLDALMRHYGAGNQVKNSIFDIYATADAKREVQDLINSQVTTTYSVVDIVQSFNVKEATGWTAVRPLNIDNKSLLYCFVACAQSTLGSESSYRAIRPIQMAGSNGPRVQKVDANVNDSMGSVSIVFTQDLYFQDTSGIQTFRPVSPTDMSSCVGTDYMTVELVCETADFGNWKILTDTGNPQPRSTNRIEFQTNSPQEGTYTFTIKPGLCDQWGNPKSNAGFSVSVTVGKDENGKWFTSVTDIPTEWRA